jgi:hypothetical protein
MNNDLEECDWLLRSMTFYQLSRGQKTLWCTPLLHCKTNRSGVCTHDEFPNSTLYVV